MFKLKKQFHLFKIVLFVGLGLLVLIVNSHQVKAMGNNKNKQKKDYNLLSEAIDNLNEGIEYFHKKDIKINLNKIKKLLSENQKRNNPTESSSSNSKKPKKTK